MNHTRTHRLSWRHLLAYGSLLLIVWLPYARVGEFEFVRFDDDVFLLNNTWINTGFSWESIKWAFTSFYSSNWHPVTWLSHMAVFHLFGKDAGPHHTANLLIHIANTLLLFWFLRKATGTFWRSWFVSAFFAVHPLHVESVAWVMERKDVLSLFWGLLAFHAYFEYIRRPGKSAYFISILFFVLSLASKPMLVTFPALLLLLNAWPFERWSKSTWKKILAESLPFWILAIVSSVVTVLAQSSGSAIASMQWGLTGRLQTAVIAYGGYLKKTFVPVDLAAFYPHPGTVSVSETAVCSAVLAVCTVVFLFLGRRYRYLSVGWLWFIGTLVPVIGLVQVGSQAMADRYTYFPHIGLFVLVVWGVADVSAGLRTGQRIVRIAGIGILAVCMFLTARQTLYWKNSVTLFEHAIAITKDNYFAHLNIANAYFDHKDIEKAVYHLQEAKKIKPQVAAIHNGLGILADYQGQSAEAVAHLREAVRLDRNDIEAKFNLSVALGKLGNYDQAEKVVGDILGRYGPAAKLHAELRQRRIFMEKVLADMNISGLENAGGEQLIEIANRFSRRGMNDDALWLLDRAALSAGYRASARRESARIHQTGGRSELAARHFQEALAEGPGHTEGRIGLAMALVAQCRIRDALDEIKTALSHDPENVRAKRMSKVYQDAYAGNLEEIERRCLEE